jgi:hypothetical protein
MSLEEDFVEFKLEPTVDDYLLPKIGDKIYIPSNYYNYGGEAEVIGYADLPKVFNKAEKALVVKDIPNYIYIWSYLQANQEEYKTKYPGKAKSIDRSKKNSFINVSDEVLAEMANSHKKENEGKLGVTSFGY